MEPVERAEKIPIQKIKVLLQNPKSKPKIYIYLNNWGVVGSYSNLQHDKTNKETYNMYAFEWLAKVAGI